MAQHIGVVASSAEGAALCYKTVCQDASILMGEHNHLQITLNSAPMAEHVGFPLRDDWKGLAQSLLVSVRKVAQAGADFAICPDNTCHQPFEHLLPKSPIPWLHIAEFWEPGF